MGFGHGHAVVAAILLYGGYHGVGIGEAGVIGEDETLVVLYLPGFLLQLEVSQMAQL